MVPDPRGQDQEIRELQTCVQDLMSLLAVPTLWSGQEDEDILRTLSESIEAALPVCFFLLDAGRASSLNSPMLRVQGVAQPADGPDWRLVVADCRGGRQTEGVHLLEGTPLGALRIVRMDLGAAPGHGAIWVGSTAKAFPNPAQITFLKAAAMLAEAGLRSARLFRERQAVDQIVAKRNARYRFLSELDDSTRPLLDANEITMTAVRQLGIHMKVEGCAYGHVHKNQDTFDIVGDYNAGLPSLVGRYRISDFGADALRLIRAGLPFVLADSESDERAGNTKEAFRKIRVRSLIGVPLLKEGRIVAGMIVHQARPREWTDDEVELVKEVANRCWESIERTRAAREFRESETRLREGLAAGRMAVWDWDMVNRKNLYAANFEEVFGRKRVDQVSNVLHPDDQERFRDDYWRAARTSGSYGSVVRMIRADTGETRWLSIRGRVKHLPNGVPIMSSIAVDVTEQHEAEQELRAADRRKDEFLAMLAHELRNPLAPIANAAQILRLLADTEPRVRQVSDIIGRQVDHMTGLVDDLLDVSRVTRGLIKLEKKPLNIADVVAEALEQVKALIEAKRHRLSVQMPDQPLQVMGDHRRLVQILTNVLNNAAKYTADGGEISLQVSASGENVVLKVTDNGVGIRADLLPHIFASFIQGQRSPDRSQGGLGLGLALVKNLVTLHEGRVSAFSRGEGMGSEFTIWLPLMHAPAEGASREAAGAREPESGKAAQMLIVDDNVDAAQSMAMLLKAAGHSVSVEYEPHQALQRAYKESPPVILLDIGLPDLDGYEMARRLRAHPRTRDALLIAVTGYGSDDDRRRSQAAGFDYHLVKPLDYAELMSALRRSAVGPPSQQTTR